MFIGHFALGFAAKRATPRIPLPVLFGAAQFADVLWPFLLATGVEVVHIDPGNTAMTPLDFASYPYSHSLLMLAIWGLAFGAIYTAVTKQRGAWLMIAALVMSHWVLDFITHGPDMPLYPGSERLGLGLWNAKTATIVLESLMYAAGVWTYARATRARDRAGRWSFAIFVVFLALIYVGNAFGGPPPSVPALYWTAMIAFPIIVIWSWQFDGHRVATNR